MKKGLPLLLLFLSCFFCTHTMAQQKHYSALFIGNSYTYTNALPDLVSQLAASTGDQLTVSSYTPGGYTFEQHASNASTLGLIDQGTWDYVILQEQSQRPSFSYQQVQNDVFPFAAQLANRIKTVNACARPVFYMTWGRKSGDQDICPYLPSVCTYEGMDNLLQQRYTMMASDNESILCPVGKLWRYLRNQYPALELYVGDGSHPSLEGSYAAACAFYSVLFKKDPSLCTYTASLEASKAQAIRNAAKLVVYDSLDYWNQFYPGTKAGYSYTLQGRVVSFIDESANTDTYHWELGDGNVSTESNPVHTYEADGLYQVTLTTTRCGESSVELKSIQVGTPTAVETASYDQAVRVYPNPAGEKLYIEATGPIVEIILSNSIGQTVKQFSDSPAMTALDIGDLESNLYFLTIRSEQRTMHTTFYKK